MESYPHMKFQVRIHEACNCCILLLGLLAQPYPIKQGPFTHLYQILHGGNKGHTSVIDQPVLQHEGSGDTCFIPPPEQCIINPFGNTQDSLQVYTCITHYLRHNPTKIHLLKDNTALQIKVHSESSGDYTGPRHILKLPKKHENPLYLGPLWDEDIGLFVPQHQVTFKSSPET